MTTIHKKEKKKKNFTNIDNSIFNSGLSYEAIGLLTHILSLPKDWSITKQYFMNLKQIKRWNIDKMFNELISFGYIKEFNVPRTKDNPAGKQYIAYEIPLSDNEFLNEK